MKFRHDDAAPFPRLSPLVVRFGAMGDVVLLTPLLKQLHLRYGHPCVVMGSGGWFPLLLQNNPDVSDVIVLRSRKRPYLLDRTQRKAVARLRSLRTGPVYVCDDYARDKIEWLLELAGISPERVVYANPDCPLGADEHWIDRWRRFGAMTPKAFANHQAVSCSQ